jgi:hypothetical protein
MCCEALKTIGFIAMIKICSEVKLVTPIKSLYRAFVKSLSYGIHVLLVV